MAKGARVQTRSEPERRGSGKAYAERKFLASLSKRSDAAEVLEAAELSLYLSSIFVVAFVVLHRALAVALPWNDRIVPLRL